MLSMASNSERSRLTETELFSSHAGELHGPAELVAAQLAVVAVELDAVALLLARVGEAVGHAEIELHALHGVILRDLVLGQVLPGPLRAVGAHVGSVAVALLAGVVVDVHIYAHDVEVHGGIGGQGLRHGLGAHVHVRSDVHAVVTGDDGVAHVH